VVFYIVRFAFVLSRKLLPVLVSIVHKNMMTMFASDKKDGCS